jgi:hypothetical protein
LIVKIQEHFQFCPKWYRRHEDVRALVGQYYVVLRSLLRQKPHLRLYRARCRHCGIYFLADPRNRGRQDLGCPFGCRQAHRRQSSARRSASYYASPEGKAKKKLHNDKRGRGRIAAPAPAGQCRPHPQVRQQEGVDFEITIVSYLSRVVSLIEGRWVSPQEIREMLTRALRQHSIGPRRKIEYVLSCWENAGCDP